MTTSGQASFFNTSFLILNKKNQQPVIYSTTETTWNVMEFTIKNNTGADVLLKGGKPVNRDVPDGASSFAFDFRSILTDAQARVMSVTDAKNEWGAQYFQPQGHANPTWAVAPLENMTFKNGDEVVFTLDNIACASQSSSQFDVLYFNVPQVSDRVYTYPILVLNIPQGKRLKDVVDFGVLNNSVFHTIGSQTPPASGSGGSTPVEIDITYDNASPIKNTFTIYLKNTTGSPLVSSGSLSGSSRFTLSFLFGTNDDDVITTQLLADQNIQISVDAEKSNWLPSNHIDNTNIWPFTPLSAGVMLAHETVTFLISSSITDLNVNPQTLSTLYIQWNFIPGYADDYYSIEMQKQAAKPSIVPSSFTISPSTINLGDNVQISYQTEVAAYITLEYGLRDGSTITLDNKSAPGISYDESGFTPLTAPDKEMTVFTLSVYYGQGEGFLAVDQQTLTITVNQPPAVIESFTVSSMLVDINSSSNSVTLTWEVTNAKTVSITGYGNQTENSLIVPVNQTTTYTLQVTPWGSNGQLQTATITVYAYKSFSPVSVGPMGDGTAFQSLPLSITNHAKRVIYVSNSQADQVYQVSQDNHQVLPTTFPGHIMTLSADEQKLFVAQSGASGPGAIRMIDTTSQAAVSTLPQPGPPPYSLAINPGGTQLYYLQQHRLTAVSAFSVNEPGNTFAYLQDIGVGTSPEAYAFDANAQNLYIGNYDSSNISVINLSQNTTGAPIPLQSSEPCAFALVGTNLFVACSGDTQVYVIDTRTNTVTSAITAGNQPFSLTLDQNKVRLFVTNFQDNSVTVIDTTALKVIKTISVGKGPSAIKITESGNLMFVSNYCDKSLTVVDLSGGGINVIGTIPLEASNGNPIDISTYQTINGYTDIFVAKEYFKGRNNSCADSTATDATLTMSIFSVQEKSSGLDKD